MGSVYFIVKKLRSSQLPKGSAERKEMYSGDLTYSGDLISGLLTVHYSNGSDALYHGLNSQPLE